MLQVTLDEAKEKLDELFEAATQGEDVFIGSNGTRVQLVFREREKEGVGSNNSQEDEAAPRRGFGSMRGTFKMAPDFDEPLEDFKEYM